MNERPNRPTPTAQVTANVTEPALLAGITRLGIAVSGGSDSVALLRRLLPLCRANRIHAMVLHLDHGLRGAASTADARFVARLAKRLGIRCRLEAAHDLKADTKTAGTGLSLEMAARVARQAFFRRVTRDERLDAIATGHTADDVAETLLLRLARGSGASGLSGLRPRSTVAGVTFVRPLLDQRHAALRAWLRRIRQTWREDASNHDQTIPRNRVRHTVLPWLERHWQPSLQAMLTQSAAILRDEDALLDRLTEQAWRQARRGAALALHRLTGLPLALQRRVVRHWLLAAGHADAAGWLEIERILSHLTDPAAWQVALPGKLLARGADGILAIGLPGMKTSGGPDNGAATVLAVPGHASVAGIAVTARHARGIVRTTGAIGHLPSVCTLDAAALQGRTLRVRTRRPGDRIRPLGLAGSKSIQDLFVDAKVPAAQRARLPLLLADDEIVWVPGYRVARAYAVRAPGAASVRVRMQAVARTRRAGHSLQATPPCTR